MIKHFFMPVLALTVVSLAYVVLPPAVTAQTIPTTTIPTSVTRVMITNATTASPYLVITPGAGSQDGCAPGLASMGTPGYELINDTTSTVSYFTPAVNGKGQFQLPANSTLELVNTVLNPAPQGGAPAGQNCMQGLNLAIANSLTELPVILGSVVGPSGVASCPDPPAAPNGIDVFEAVLNLPQTSNNGMTSSPGNEAIDLSCVNGANTIIEMTINAPASNTTELWQYDGTVTTPKTIAAGSSLSSQNSWVLVSPANGGVGCDDNCVLPGATAPNLDRPWVYPYGCTFCNEYPDNNPSSPHPCGAVGVAGGGQFCAADNGLPNNTGCGANRAPVTTNIQTQKFGGTLLVTYLGPAMPPVNCTSSGGGGGGGGGHHGGFPPSNSKCKLGPKPTAKELREYYQLKRSTLEIFKNDHVQYEKGMGGGCVNMMMY